jgi:hypothetical protein
VTYIGAGPFQLQFCGVIFIAMKSLAEKNKYSCRHLATLVPTHAQTGGSGFLIARQQQLPLLQPRVGGDIGDMFMAPEIEVENL